MERETGEASLVLLRLHVQCIHELAYAAECSIPYMWYVNAVIILYVVVAVCQLITTASPNIAVRSRQLWCDISASALTIELCTTPLVGRHSLSVGIPWLTKLPKLRDVTLAESLPKSDA